MNYFRKEILSNRIVLKTRQPQWESVGNDEGALATDNEDLIRELGEMADRGRGGVVRISEEEYEELKKKPVSQSRARPRLGEAWHDPNPPRTTSPKLDLPVAGGTRVQSLTMPEEGAVKTEPNPPPPPKEEPIKPPLSFAAAGPKPAKPKATKAGHKSPFDK